MLIKFLHAGTQETSGLYLFKNHNFCQNQLNLTTKGSSVWSRQLSSAILQLCPAVPCFSRFIRKNGMFYGIINGE